jgi:hypothetical protein
MSAALGLYRLQQVDSQIDQIRRLKSFSKRLKMMLNWPAERFKLKESKDAERTLKQADQI